MKKILILFLICILSIFVTTFPVEALTVWKFEDWQTENNYGHKTKVSQNITNLKGEEKEDDGMKIGPYNKRSLGNIKEGIIEEVYVGINLANYQNSELFELSIALNQQVSEQEEKYLTEAVVMTQKNNNQILITAGWAKDKNPIAIIDKDGVYTYRWEFQKQTNNKIKVKFTVFDYEKELGTTDFIELDVANADKATNVRYLWACNIKANHGIDIYTTLPERQGYYIENPATSDINFILFLGLFIVGILGLVYVIKQSK